MDIMENNDYKASIFYNLLLPTLTQPGSTLPWKALILFKES